VSDENYDIKKKGDEDATAEKLRLYYKSLGGLVFELSSGQG